MRKLNVVIVSSFFVLGWLVLSACVVGSTAAANVQVNNTITASPTPFRPLLPTETPVPSLTPTEEVIPVELAVSLPPALLAGLQITAPWQVVEQHAALRLDVQPAAQGAEKGDAAWVYVLVAPFPTVVDGITSAQMQALWQGQTDLEELAGKPLLMSAATQAAFTGVWGTPADGATQVLPTDQLLDAAWAQSSWALVGFEDLEPRWKVLKVDGFSPLEKNFDPLVYPLTLYFGWQGDEALAARAADFVALPASNRDPQKMTVVVMTGVTALTRATAWKMELNGMDYPARDILTWLKDADFLHISNEVSFNPLCEYPDPAQPNLMFCSDPRYIELLDYIGADVIELSGNHNVDRGMDAFVHSLDLYRQRGWGVYVGGMNLEEARQPLLLEHHGNRLAFIGCNLAGPERVWATEDTPGEATCDYEYIDSQLATLRAEGYLPIFTYQYYESYSPSASTPQKEDFRARAAAGAVIVQGSQAHRPQGMEFANGAFIHHGLGNLFFDQMEVTGVTGTRDEFIDRHVFYNGRYIGTELLTALLEDYARPRPMTTEERQSFLKQMFKASGW